MTATSRITERQIYEMHAEVCSVLSSPKRLEIINVLREGEKAVNELAEEMDLPKANVSQQLAILRDKGLVTTRREGQRVYYRLTHPEMLKAYDLLRAMLFKQLEERGKLAGAYRTVARRSSR